MDNRYLEQSAPNISGDIQPDLRRSIFLVLFISILIDATASGLITPVITQILAMGKAHLAAANDVSKSGTSAVYALGFIVAISPAYIFLAPAIGFISDLYGRKKTLVACLINNTCSYTLLLTGCHINSIMLMLFAMLLFSAGSATLNIVQANILDISDGWHRNYYLGFIAFALLSMFISTSFSEYLLSKHATFSKMQTLIIAAALIMSLFNVFFVRKKLYASKQPQRQAPSTQDGWYEALASAFANKRIFLFILLVPILEYAWGLYTQNIIGLLASSNVSSANIFIIYKVIIMLASVTILYPLISRRYKLNTLLFSCLILGSLGLLIICFSHTTMALGFAIVPAAIAEAISLPILWALIAEKTDSRSRGLIMGIQGTFFSLSWTASILTADLLNQLRSSLPIYFATSTLIILCSIFLFYRHKISK